MLETYLLEYQEAKAAGKETRTLRRQFIESYKLGKSCEDCKFQYPPHIMQFDHVRGTKVGNLTDLARNGSMEEVLEEIEKCELVCANCHAHRTWLRSKNKKQGRGDSK